MRTLALGLTAIAMLGITGCSTDSAPESQSEDITVGGVELTPWAVDMKKVDEHYGSSSEYFFGLSAAEMGLPPQIPGADQPSWDLTVKKNPDHTAHVETGENIAVIDRQGNEIDPPGYVNIIPMLPDTDPADQTHIKKWLKDGDVLVYIHPEDTSPKDQMERRSSHVAMHYEYTTQDGTELVHHIDNPNSYGPRYNHPANRHMPFHVYRFQPKEDKSFHGAPSGVAESLEGVDFSAGQRDGVLALINQEMEAEAKMELLDVTLKLDKRAAENIINALPINQLADLGPVPYVGPDALGKLRDAVTEDSSGFTISNEMAEQYGMAARNWGLISNDLSPFAGFFELTMQEKGDIASFAEAAINGQQMPKLYCSGLAYANLNLALNTPLNAGGLGALHSTFQSSSYRFSDAEESNGAERLSAPDSLKSIDRLVFRPYAATDILTEWVDVNMAHLPVPARQAVLQTPDLQGMIVQGFSNLEWSDESNDKSQSGSFTPATMENVQRWAAAYGRTAAETEGFLAADAELAEQFNSLGVPSDGLTPMDVLQAVEREHVETRFVPPRIWLDEGDKLDSDMIYVGTVLNCEILTDPSDPSNDPCAGAGNGASEFSEGAADTSTYAHYGIPDGGQRTHRRFDGSPGPEQMGRGSSFKVRATGNSDDIRFSLHVPEHWAGQSTIDMSMMDFDRHCTEQGTEAGCAPSVGIYLDTAVANGGEGAPAELRDWTGNWKLDEICTWDEGSPTMSCPGITTESGAPALFEATVDRNAHGPITITMYDVGDSAAGFADELCTNCEAGGAHFNQAYVKVRND